jgi:DNA polymerase-3 subunit alpha
MAALLTSDQDNIDRVAIEVDECKEMGIEVLPPNVNESFEEFAVIIDPDTKEEKIRFGLNAIKNVGHTVAHEIVQERKRGGKFLNLTNFVERVRHKDLNKKSIEALAKVGALEELAGRNEVLSSIDNILAHSKNIEKLNNSRQNSLFGMEDIKLPEIKLETSLEASKKEKLAWEKELLGLYISDHPIGEYKDYLEKMATPIKKMAPELVGQQVSIGGIISKLKKIYLKNQKMMAFATIEDLDSHMEILVFPKILEDNASIWTEGNIILATGKISDKDGEFKLLCDSVKTINEKELENFQRVLNTQKKNGYKDSIQNHPHPFTGEMSRSDREGKLIITLPDNFDKEILKNLSSFFDRCDLGATKVYLSINGSKLETPYCIKNTAELEAAIKKISPEGKIEII